MKNEYKNSCVLYILRFSSLKPITQSWQTCKLLNDDANNNLGHLFLMSNVSIGRNGRESLLVHVFWGDLFCSVTTRLCPHKLPTWWIDDWTDPFSHVETDWTHFIDLSDTRDLLTSFFIFSYSLSLFLSRLFYLLSVVSKMSVKPVSCWLGCFFVKSFFFLDVHQQFRVCFVIPSF